MCRLTGQPPIFRHVEVDRKTRRSYIEHDELIKMEGVRFTSHY